MGSVLLKVVGILCRTLLDTYVAQIHEQGIALVHFGVARNFCLTLPHDIPDSSTCVLSEGAGLDTIERAPSVLHLELPRMAVRASNSNSYSCNKTGCYLTVVPSVLCGALHVMKWPHLHAVHR